MVYLVLANLVLIVHAALIIFVILVGRPISSVYVFGNLT